MIQILSMLPRFRRKIDDISDVKDILPQDGTSYTVNLTNSPVISGSFLLPNHGVYLNHSTFTTGLNQFIPQNGYQSAAYASGNNITYIPNYIYGELSFYQGSGTVIAQTGLVPFAPWSTSSAIAYYQTAQYTDSTLADYLSYAVAEVESSIQIGLAVSGVSSSSVPVVPPSGFRDQSDIVMQLTGDPYLQGQVFVIGETPEIIQELIASRAAISLTMRERRLSAGGAVTIKDGDTYVSNSDSAKLIGETLKDFKADYGEKLRFVMQNLLDGVSLRTIDELATTTFGYSNRGGLAIPTYY